MIRMIAGVGVLACLSAHAYAEGIAVSARELQCPIGLARDACTPETAATVVVLEEVDCRLPMSGGGSFWQAKVAATALNHDQYYWKFYCPPRSTKK